jgi:hypothetical protein
MFFVRIRNLVKNKFALNLFSLFRHSREGGNPGGETVRNTSWIPAFAGMTVERFLVIMQVFPRF